MIPIQKVFNLLLRGQVIDTESGPIKMTLDYRIGFFNKKTNHVTGDLTMRTVMELLGKIEV